ncbi:acyl-CoA dehydrogenase [Pseudoalteromonas sp. Cnat2-41]|uniref:acyl-CoA dehydrogenase n=1 Tax=Pseudoalteromonas TaxID=53246 RepID=UPI001EF7B7D7|nr:MULTISPECIES: acyl-CoA dehydrogenase [Pseudoalteromonas]MCF2862925.1 acyl-CoA dehydrogenase [Pseudoalteromonas sp. CNAT2-18]MCG7559077.1 acyl-CoA dehydrogenase [Pseudoalteromonas sp. CNAT2-18.1]|tara:strand:+ start:2132 stop:4405 length:2274 start_codon:yes stop_codon:yes gene_type:complete
MWLVLLIIVAVIVIFAVRDIRMSIVTRPVFKWFKQALPPLSATERDAMEAGDIWWDGELFRGNPDWHQLHQYATSQLSAEEREFIDNQVVELCAMLDDETITAQQDMPESVWQYLKDEGFFALIIPKEHGGHDFSALANSTIVAKIASKSLSAAVTVMVPNSLGPAELLLHYGTLSQQQQWLPKLAKGEALPCFALTGPEAGSDAGAIPDTGVVCKGEFAGKEVLGLRLNWSKRYITLAPRATVLGLAFKMFDPDGLLGTTKNIGITCALIPTDHPGVRTGDRHKPMNMGFLNGTTEGKDVFIPLEWIIGGEVQAGNGWRMLVECLSAGRGISLPALSTATGHLSARTSGAYAALRQQFGVAIGEFEGIQEALARIGGLTYQLEATRVLTATAIDQKLSPSVITAIAKYHMTEMGRQVINDALDIHAGKGIQMGPNNYLAHCYMGTPVSITVEGANILTRNLMIFGQGAIRCHPYVIDEMVAAGLDDEEKGVREFDPLLCQHMLYSAGNGVMSFVHALTGSYFAKAPVGGATAKYYRYLGRFSRALAFCADIAMLRFGGDLKRREMLSARLGDVLSHLYLASAVLKRYQDEGHQHADLPFVQYSVERSLYLCAKAFDEFIYNLGSWPLSLAVRAVVLPLGNHFKMPKDEVAKQVAQHMTRSGVVRERLTHLCVVDDSNGTAVLDKALEAQQHAAQGYREVHKLRKKGEIQGLTMMQLIEDARAKNKLSAEQSEQLIAAESLRQEVIAVDVFAAQEFE